MLDRRTEARLAGGSQRMLKALVAGGLLAQSMVWGESISLAGAPDSVHLRDRYKLAEAETLIVWTAPPGPDEFYAAIKAVAPRQVVLVGIDPGLDTLRAFVQRLAGLVKYALREYGGRARLSALAAAMAHSVQTVRLGLEWMAQKGQVDVAWEGNIIVLSTPICQAPARGALDERDAGRLHVVQGQLQARLEETAAYRAYLQTADAERLVNSGLNS